jgi:uncharacterized membrane protein YphA (DoxX/SURF4 family)
MSTDAESQRLSIPVPGLQYLTQAQFGGVLALLVGISQMVVGTVALDGLLTVAVAWGGGLLVLFGSNLIRNRPAFSNGWNENGDHGVFSLLILTLATTCILVAAGLILLG